MLSNFMAALAAVMNFRARRSPTCRDGYKIGPGVRNCRLTSSGGGHGASLGKFPDTRLGMPVPPSAGPNYLKFKVDRQLHRALARQCVKDAKHTAYLARRRLGLAGRKATRVDQANLPVSA